MSEVPRVNGQQLDALTPEQKRALLAKLLQQKEMEEQRAFPMSFSQQRLWFLDQLSPGNPFYNVEAAVSLGGPLDVQALQRAINEIVRRHEVLRTTFRTVGGEPMQVVAPQLEVDLPVVDLRDLPAREQEAEVLRWRIEESTRPFDLASGPLLRTTLLRLASSRYLFLIGMHHIVSDGWSMGVFGREMEELYSAYVFGKTPQLPELPIQYGDFALWQRKYLLGETLQQQLSYWRAQLDGLSPLDLPTDHARPPVQTFRGAFHNISIPTGLTEALKRLSRQHGVTLFMTLLTAFKILLHRYTDQEDIVVGTYIAGRNRAEIEPLIGFFLNTLVLRTRIEDDLTVRQSLQRVREVAVGAYAHQDLPFDKLVEELHPDRDLSRNPLFQVSFQLTNAPTQKPIDDPESALDSRRGTSIFDLAFMLFETTRGISGQFEYSTDLFEPDTIERMAGHFQVLLEGMVEDSDRPIHALPLLTKAEERRVLLDFNATDRPLASASGLVERFEQQVARSPQGVALMSGDRTLSYSELDLRANRIANHLRSSGVRPGNSVGLCLERSLEMVAALLGIFKTGAVYLPLDPSYPAERLALMLADSGAGHLLTDRAGVSRFPGFTGRTIDLDRERTAIDSCAAISPGIHVGPEEPAYLIYTSGSTGRPKGIAAPHRQILNRLEWMWREYPFAPGEVGCQKTASSFVDALWELFGPLLRGVPSVVVPDAVVRDPQELVQALGACGVTRLWVVPSMLNMLLDHFPDIQERLPALEFWVSSGEPLSPELLERFERVMPRAVLFNLYGTSEVWDVTWYDPRALVRPPRRVPIGAPIDNMRVYVLDRRRQPVPVGIPGELYVAGAGVAHGYIGQPQLTERRFVPLALRHVQEPMAYRTGDLVCFRPDGILVYLGRLDRQVKVRGYRVEPEEIESALATHPDLRDVAVIVDDVGRLIACYSPVTQPGPSTEELRQLLLDRLPQYMVPNSFVSVEHLPLTPSGKLDRGSLAALVRERPGSQQAYVAPRPGTEQDIAAIWEEVLRTERVGANDNFFDHGGHSLLATQVMSRLKVAFEVEVPLRQIFETPTVAGMALAVDQARGQSLRNAAPSIARLPREKYRVELPEPMVRGRPAR